MRTQFRLLEDNKDYIDITISVNIENYNDFDYYSIEF